MSTSQAYSRHQLVRLSIVGGFLDGQSFDFATAMNCVIGARGTGKTTVLEFTRWAMDALPSDLTERRRIEELVSRNLKGGRVDLTVRGVQRTFKEQDRHFPFRSRTHSLRSFIAVSSIELMGQQSGRSPRQKPGTHSKGIALGDTDGSLRGQC